MLRHFAARFEPLALLSAKRVLIECWKRRPGPTVQVNLAEHADSVSQEVDIVALDGALEQLATLDPRQAQIVELRFFGGLTQEEVASTLGVSLATANRLWRLARAWLYERVG